MTDITKDGTAIIADILTGNSTYKLDTLYIEYTNDDAMPAAVRSAEYFADLKKSRTSGFARAHANTVTATDGILNFTAMLTGCDFTGGRITSKSKLFCVSIAATSKVQGLPDIIVATMPITAATNLTKNEYIAITASLNIG